MSNNGDWQSLYEVASNLRKEEIWSLDLPTLRYIQKRKIKYVFWKDVISSWFKHKEIYIDDIDIRTYPIWNSNFLNNKNLLCHKQEFEEKGLTLINDVLDNTGTLMGFDTFKRTFDLKINFVDYYSVIHSIPRSYRIFLSTNKKKLKGGDTVQVYAKLLIMKKVCRKSYWTLMNTIKVK